MDSKLSLLISDKYFKYLSPWQACILAGCLSIGTSIFDLIYSFIILVNERNDLVTFLLFVTIIESILFIVASILLFIGIYKKNKYFLIPWLCIAIIDVVLALTLAFVEISIPYRNIGSPCIVSLAGLLITIGICILIVYCFLAVYHQYCLFDKTRNYPNRKVTPSNLSISEKIKPGEKGVKFTDED